MYVSTLSGLLRPARGKKASLGKYRVTKGGYREAPLQHYQRTGAERERERKYPGSGATSPRALRLAFLGSSAECAAVTFCSWTRAWWFSPCAHRSLALSK
jgi:hypothetical protein